MLPKAANSGLSDDEVKAAVDYMANQFGCQILKARFESRNKKTHRLQYGAFFLYPIACVRRPNHGKAITDLVQTLGGNGGIRRFPAAVSAHLFNHPQQTRQAV